MDYTLKPVKEITFINGKNQITRKVKNYGWDAYKDEKGNDLKYIPEGGTEETLWAYAIYELEK